MADQPLVVGSATPLQPSALTEALLHPSVTHLPTKRERSKADVLAQELLTEMHSFALRALKGDAKSEEVEILPRITDQLLQVLVSGYICMELNSSGISGRG